MYYQAFREHKKICVTKFSEIIFIISFLKMSYTISVYNYKYMKYKCFSPIHYTFENIRFSKAKEKFNLQYLYMSPYVSWQVDLLNLDNVYPLGIRQKISKSIIKTSFATAQISSRFYFIQFFQKTIQNVLSCLLIG